MSERFDHCDDCEQVHATGYCRIEVHVTPIDIPPYDRIVTWTEPVDVCTQCPRTAIHDDLCATHYADEYGYTPATP